MRIQSSKIVEAARQKQYAGKSPSAAASFAKVMEAANTVKEPAAVPGREILPVGVISNEQPTVSDILVNSNQFHNDTWKIIQSASNARKNYDRMQPGTKVFIDGQTLELIWDRDKSAPPLTARDNSEQSSSPQQEETPGSPSAAAAASTAVLPADTGEEPVQENSERISIGRLDRKNSSVSRLLLQNPQYGRDAWRILQADSNRGKAFTRIRAGEEIFIDPRTLELSWQRSAPQQVAGAPEESEESAAVTAPAEESSKADSPADPFSSNLVRAVQSYLGKSYREINCYGLVVRGLSRMGIKYVGHGGLQNQLVQMAKSKGLPENAYMTGEGLIEASGEKVYSTSLNAVKNVEKTAGKIYDEIEPFLQKGYILSFSTPTRGHTGVISQHDEMWTFINSGYMDHQVEKSRRAKGVGEEDLAKEIKNWCQVAAKKGESLVITLGRLQEEKLRTAQLENQPALQKGL